MKSSGHSFRDLDGWRRVLADMNDESRPVPTQSAVDELHVEVAVKLLCIAHRGRSLHERELAKQELAQPAFTPERLSEVLERLCEADNSPGRFFSKPPAMPSTFLGSGGANEQANREAEIADRRGRIHEVKKGRH